MELCSLHPISDVLAAAYVQQLNVETRRYLSMGDRSGQNSAVEDLAGSNGNLRRRIGDREILQMGFGLAGYLALSHPTYAADGLSLTAWEARVDRGLAMLLRPPSRLFTDAGLPESIARRMPIRLDLGEGMMGGAYIPARLLPQAHELFSRNLKRSVRRMIDADMDATTLQGLMMEAADYALTHRLGLFEAVGLIDYSNAATWPIGSQIHVQPTNKEIVRHIAEAAKPDPKPGAFSRMLRKLNRG